MTTIKMDVMAINEECTDCPELEIDIDRYSRYSIATEDIKNVLFCKHYHRCEKIFALAMKAAKEEIGG